MAAVSLFWNTNMAAMTSCENAQFDKVASKKHTQLKTREQKPYPIYDHLSPKWPKLTSRWLKTLSFGATHTPM